MFDLHDDPGLLISSREILLLGHSAVPLPATWAVAANTPRRILAGADAGARLVSGVNGGEDDRCGGGEGDGGGFVCLASSHPGGRGRPLSPPPPTHAGGGGGGAAA